VDEWMIWGFDVLMNYRANEQTSEQAIFDVIRLKFEFIFNPGGMIDSSPGRQSWVRKDAIPI